MNLLENREELLTTLNDLVKINRDRVERYKKASEQIKKSPTLKQMFDEYAAHSKKFIADLEQYVDTVSANHINDTPVSGKIFRGWTDIKAAYKPADTPTILDSCEFEDEATLKAYGLAVRSGEQLDRELWDMINEQKENIQTAYDQIRKLSRSLNKINL